MNQPIRLQAHLATDWLITHQNLLIIISKSSHRAFENVLAESKATFIEDPPLEQSELDARIPRQSFEWIVGIGGGRVMDTAKYIAKIMKRPLCLIPSILSTTSWLNMGIALRNRATCFFPEHTMQKLRS